MLELAIQSLARAFGMPPVSGTIRQSVDDFQVTELPLLEPAGSGEHAWIWLRKRNTNTPVLAQRLARLAGVPVRDVGYAGLKDRQAVTEQWFSVRLAGRQEPDWRELDDDDTRVLRHARHTRKLQRGALEGNAFGLVIRTIRGERDQLEQRLQQVCSRGVPNYFGAQRFGRNGSNLHTAQRLFVNPRLRLSRTQHGLALSAARALLFNRVLSARIERGCWDRPVRGDAMQLAGSHSFFIAEALDAELLGRVNAQDVHPTGPLCGRGETPVKEDCLILEANVLAEFVDWVAGLETAGVRQARRALRVVPANFTWRWLDEDSLELAFSLPAGSYATAVLRELVDYQDASLSQPK